MHTASRSEKQYSNRVVKVKRYIGVIKREREREHVLVFESAVASHTYLVYTTVLYKRLHRLKSLVISIGKSHTRREVYSSEKRARGACKSSVRHWPIDVYTLFVYRRGRCISCVYI